MNKLEANISLFIITFFAAIQYVFLALVPEGVSTFAFLSITYLAGFLVTLAFFFNELFRLDFRQILQSMIVSAELIVFNVFLLLGVSGVGPTITAAVLSAYFLFIVMISALIFRQRTEKNIIIGILIVLAGLFFMMDADFFGLWNINILYLIAADIALAVYIMTVGIYSASSNPSILSMGQLFFSGIFALVLWICESILYKTPLTLPVNKEFWFSVIFTSFFMRGLYGIIQVYAQRYTTALNTALIFSTEIVITLFVSPVLAIFFGSEPEVITSLKVLGSVLIVLGILFTDGDFFNYVKSLFHAKT